MRPRRALRQYVRGHSALGGVPSGAPDAATVAAGLFTAFIDGEQDGTRAEIDDQGRYKVRVRYDEGPHDPNKASQYIRKAEPYAGPSDTGMHFPLLKGTEVLLCCLNGDVDRPVIIAAAANPLTPNVTSERNHTFNRFRSPAGTMFEMNDGLSNERPVRSLKSLSGPSGKPPSSSPWRGGRGVSALRIRRALP